MQYTRNRTWLIVRQIAWNAMVPRRLGFEQVALGFAVLAGVGLGAFTALIGPMVSGWTAHKVILASLAGPALLAIVIARNIPQALLIATVLAIPVNFSFAPLGKVPGHAGGAQAGLVLYMYDFPLIALGGCYALRALLSKQRLHISGPEIAGVLLVLWAIVSTLVADNVRFSAFEILRMVKLVLLAHIAGAVVRTTSDLQNAIRVLMAGLVLQSVIGILQSVFQLDLLDMSAVGNLHRATGTFGWPNTLGGYAAMLNALGFAFWIFSPDDRSRLLFLGAWVGGLLALALTLSRGAWLAQAASCLVVLALGLYGRRVRPASLIRVGPILLAVCIVALAYQGAIASRLHEQTFSDRLLLNRVAYQMIGDRPVAGIGVNNFVNALPDYDRYGLATDFPEPVHNVFLLFAAETGLVGLMLFVGVILIAAVLLLAAVPSADATLSVSAIGLLGSLTALATSNLMDVHLRTEALYALFWLIAGLATAIHRMSSNTSQPAHRQGRL